MSPLRGRFHASPPRHKRELLISLRNFPSQSSHKDPEGLGLYIFFCGYPDGGLLEFFQFFPRLTLSYAPSWKRRAPVLIGFLHDGLLSSNG